MADFFQTGAITTLHRLHPSRLKALEGELENSEVPLALILPCHVRDLHAPALRHIVQVLRGVRYLRRVIVGLDGPCRRADYEGARRLFSKMPTPLTFVHKDSPRMRRIFSQLKEAGIHAGTAGKGRNVWLSIGCALAHDEIRAVAVHDCDVLTYDRELLARLCQPVMRQSLGFDFCKGYYARTSDRLNGRVTRLFLAPVLRALRELLGPLPFLTYLGSFRYALAGEFAMHTDLARRVRMPRDWALEIGMLAEVFRHSSSQAICQSELCENYDHKHQGLSPRNPSKGLNRMAQEIASSLFHKLAADGVKLDSGLFESLPGSYQSHAEDALRSYSADAAINGLIFSRHDEEIAVATFSKSLQRAARAFLVEPLSTSMIPSWDRVQTAMPGIFDTLRTALDADNGMLKTKTRAPGVKVRLSSTQ